MYGKDKATNICTFNQTLPQVPPGVTSGKGIVNAKLSDRDRIVYLQQTHVENPWSKRWSY